MKLEEGIEHILNGNAILFCGSGFSRGATSKIGKSFLVGDGLIKEMCDKLSIVDSDLDYVSTKFQKTFGVEALTKLLIENFTAISVQEYHEVIANLPWRKIYTTNYDNVIELAGKKITRRPVTLKDTPDKILKHDELVIHLNGSIQSNITEESLSSEIKLTKASYLSRIFTDSKWYNIFTHDLKSIKALFFIGFSLDFDLEIQQVISSVNQKDKTFFINGTTTTEKAKEILSDYGSVLELGTKELSEKIKDFSRTFIETSYSPLLYCFKEFNLDRNYIGLKDKDITDLLFYGKYDKQLYYNHSEKYTFKRSIITKVKNSLDNDKKIIIIHSELGNGKSISLEILKVELYLEQKYFIYTINEMDDRLYQDLCKIIEKSTDKKKSVIFIDNYNNYFRLLKHLNELCVDNIILVLSARSYIHEISYTELSSFDYFDINLVAEYSLNKLEDSEINSLLNYFGNHEYIWGRKSTLKRSSKQSFLKNTCKGSIKTILLSLFEENSIKDKILDIEKEICKNKENQELLYFTIVNSLLSLDLDLNDILALLDKVGESSKISRCKNMRELIDIDSNDIKIKSPVLASFILSHTNKKNDILDLMIKIMKKLDSIAYTEKMRNIQFMLISQSAFEMLVVKQKYKEEYEQNIITYYEQIKNMNYCKENIYFWIQYANVRISIKDFDVARLYLDRASAFKKENFHYQFDTCKARFILENQLYNDSFEKTYDIFYEAHQLLYKNKNRKEKWFFPLKQTTLYFDYYVKFFNSFSENERALFIKNCQDILKKIKEYTDEQNKINGEIHWRVKDAEMKLKQIVR